MRLPASDCARAKMSNVAGAMWPPSSAWHPGGGRRLVRGLRCGEKWRPSSGPHRKFKFQTLIESYNSVIGSNEIDTRPVKIQEKTQR
jgi:hypothetical protein